MQPAGGVDVDPEVELVFERGDLTPPVVLEGVGQLGVELDLDPLDRPGHRLALDQPQEIQPDHLGAADPPGPLAGGAVAMGAHVERLLDLLPVDLDQTVGADPAHRVPRLVGLQRLLEGGDQLALVAAAPHVDEVDDDDAADVAQPELAGDLVGRLEVGVERRLLLAALLCRATRVDVDGGQRLGAVDDDRAAAGQLDLALEDALDLRLQLEA